MRYAGYRIRGCAASALQHVLVGREALERAQELLDLHVRDNMFLGSRDFGSLANALGAQGHEVRLWRRDAPALEALHDQGAWGAAIARPLYQHTRPGYHSDTRGNVDEILGWENSATP